MKRYFLGLMMTGFTLFSFCLQAQIKVTGTVADSLTNSAISGANVLITGTKNGTTTGINGQFSLDLLPGKYQVRISSVGYLTKVLGIECKEGSQCDLGRIWLQPNTITLQEINILSSVAGGNTTPVALTTIQAKQIRDQLGDQPFPDILKMTPGVYATRTGGGSGDAEVNIRGFQQENVAVLLNGIPVSSVENGLVYWNNWIGLADATQSIQVQRGLGASNVALNSIGGTINIVTKSTEANKGGAVSFSTTNYGNSKMSLSLSSGRMNNGFAVNFLGAYTRGPGYVDATYVESWAYFLSVSKEFSKNHKLVFTALGAPERHGQRNLKLSKAEIGVHGITYNKDWGSYNGELNNASENFYHKPYITLNDYLHLSDRIFLATSAYFSPGYGGGKWSETYGFGTPGVFQYRNPSGQIDWEKIYQNNFYHTDTAILSTGEKVTGFSKNVQTHFLASHVWGGLLSRLEFEKSEHAKFTAGVHFRHFTSKLQEKVADLLGGKYFIDDYAWAVDGAAGREQIKNVGDVIKINNGAWNPSGSIFLQADFGYEKLSGFVSGTFTNTWYKRWDEYNYVENTTSEVLSRTGYDVKAGISYRLRPDLDIYLNGGNFSRTPYYKYVFGNFTNIPTKDLANETVRIFELGCRFQGDFVRLYINGYYSQWLDKNFLSNEYIQLENNTQTRALVTGLDALHQGIELELTSSISNYLQLGGMLSAGNWKWQNDVSATLFNDQNQAVDTVNVFAKGLYVGGAPQFQAGLFGKIRLMKQVEVTGNWILNDKIYSSFDPSNRNNADDRRQSWQLPAYSLLDLHVSVPFRFFEQHAAFNVSCFNVYDKEHIVRGEDGTEHDEAGFTGFWGFGRNFSFALHLSF